MKCSRVMRQQVSKLFRSNKNISVSNEIFSYSETMSSELPELIKNLQQETESTLSNSGMMSSPVVLRLNMMLCQAVRARKILDIGVFTGSSSLAASLATDDDAKIYALEKSGKYINIARKYWSQAGVEHKIELRLGDAGSSLDKLLDEGHGETFDLCYIDADKGNYREYFDKSVELTRRGGIITVDNTLFRGLVLDEDTTNKTALAVQNFNKHAKHHPDVRVLMLPIADGLTIATKK